MPTQAWLVLAVPLRAVWTLVLVARGGPSPSSSSSSSSSAAAPPPEVGVYMGPHTKQNHDLRLEAKSTRHLLRHKPFNKYCEACQKSKMAERKHMAGSFQRDLKSCREIITADHLVSRKDNWSGVQEYRNSVNLDVYSKLIASVPVHNKGHEEARKAF